MRAAASALAFGYAFAGAAAAAAERAELAERSWLAEAGSASLRRGLAQLAVCVCAMTNICTMK